MKRLTTIRDGRGVASMARWMGIDLFIGDVSKRVRRVERDGWFFGPQGSAYSPARRAVMIARDHDWEGKDDARVFHELAHLVCAVPFFRHEQVPEELFLLQWEEEAVKAAGINWDNYIFYRGTTFIRSAGSRRLNEIVKPEFRRWWWEGRDRAQRLGLLGVSLGFTASWPDWRRLSDKDRDLLLRWRAKGFG